MQCHLRPLTATLFLNFNYEAAGQPTLRTCSATSYKKLSYPQRKCASNVAILYGADGISI